VKTYIVFLIQSISGREVTAPCVGVLYIFFHKNVNILLCLYCTVFSEPVAYFFLLYFGLIARHVTNFCVKVSVVILK
jgi:hypothetical protein